MGSFFFFPCLYTSQSSACPRCSTCLGLFIPTATCQECWKSPGAEVGEGQYLCGSTLERLNKYFHFCFPRWGGAFSSESPQQASFLLWPQQPLWTQAGRLRDQKPPSHSRAGPGAGRCQVRAAILAPGRSFSPFLILALTILLFGFSWCLKPYPS
jgi:hypothetical protein